MENTKRDPVIIQAKKFLKLSDIVEPIVGQYIRVEKSTYSPVYVIEDEVGRVVQILGCTDLNNKMAQVAIGSFVAIRLLESVPTKFGKDKLIAEVIAY